tara:strand:+ start:461 stop:619 length:159 start_codon:yes stop_codon:yes gene_type:complete
MGVLRIRFSRALAQQQVEEMPGFVKRHAAINANNIVRFEDFTACGEELALAA